MSSEDGILRHFSELRKRLFFSLLWVIFFSIVSYLFYHRTWNLLIQPIQSLSIGESELHSLFFVGTFFEGFSARIKLSLTMGFILSIPFLMYQVFRFVFPGLTRPERRWILAGSLASLFLGVFGFYVAYVFLLPISLAFLTSAEFIPTDATVLLHFKQNMGYLVNILVGSMVLFQFPIGILMILAIGVVGRGQLIRSSRYIVLGIFILTALITPPDVVSQVGMSLPLVVLFYLAIGFAALFRIGRK